VIPIGICHGVNVPDANWHLSLKICCSPFVYLILGPFSRDYGIPAMSKEV